MTAADRILIRKAECAAVLDLLRPRVAGDAARLLEARLAGLSDALMEATAADAEPEPEAPLPLMTAEREALLRRVYHDRSIRPQQIVAALNQLPGATVRAGSLQWLAQRLGLGGRKSALPPTPPAAAEPATPAAPAPSPSAAAPAPIAPDRTKAVALMRDGYGDQVIAKRAGLPLAQVAALRAEAEEQARQMLRQGAMGTEDISVATGLPPGDIRDLRAELARATRTAAA